MPCKQQSTDIVPALRTALEAVLAYKHQPQPPPKTESRPMPRLDIDVKTSAEAVQADPAKRAAYKLYAKSLDDAKIIVHTTVLRQ